MVSPLERGARRVGCVLLLLLHTPKSPLQRGLIILSKAHGSCRSKSLCAPPLAFFSAVYFNNKWTRNTERVEAIKALLKNAA